MDTTDQFRAFDELEKVLMTPPNVASDPAHQIERTHQQKLIELSVYFKMGV